MRKPQRVWLIDSDAADPVYAVAHDAAEAKRVVQAAYPALVIHDAGDVTTNVQHANEESEHSLWTLRNDAEPCVVFLNIISTVKHRWERVQGQAPDVRPGASSR